MALVTAIDIDRLLEQLTEEPLPNALKSDPKTATNYVLFGKCLGRAMRSRELYTSHQLQAAMEKRNSSRWVSFAAIDKLLAGQTKPQADTVRKLLDFFEADSEESFIAKYAAELDLPATEGLDAVAIGVDEFKHAATMHRNDSHKLLDSVLDGKHGSLSNYFLLWLRRNGR